MPSRHQFLEHFAQHLWVDGDLDIEGCGLHHGEIELVKQLSQNRRDGAVGHDDSVAFVQVGLPRTAHR